MSGDRPRKPAGWYSKEQRAARAAKFREGRARAAAERAAAEAKAPGADLRAQAARLAADAKQRLRERNAVAPVPQFEQRMARLAKAAKRERQRFDHLVMGKPRPAPVLVRPEGLTRREWKAMRQQLLERGMILEPGIEEAVRRREMFDYGRGTPETNEKHHVYHSDSLHQMEINGTIDKEQRENATAIANVYRSIESDVAVTVASLEARVDNSSRGAAQRVAERINRVRLHLAYTIWRGQLPEPKQAVLDMIVGDAVGYTVVAKRYGMHARKAKRWLIQALDAWPSCVDRAYSVVDAEVYARLTDSEPAALPMDWRTPLLVEPPSPALPPVVIAAVDVGEPEPVPEMRPVAARFLDDKGYMLPWQTIAGIIREELHDVDDGQEAA